MHARRAHPTTSALLASPPIPISRRAANAPQANAPQIRDGTSHQGHQGGHLPLDYYELTVEPGATVTLDVQPDRSVMAFTLEGSARIGGLPLGPKTAVKLEKGNQVAITATDDKPSVVLVMSSLPLGEPIAWGGPIVMNTLYQLHEAFRQLDDGTFLQQGITVE